MKESLLFLASFMLTLGVVRLLYAGVIYLKKRKEKEK